MYYLNFLGNKYCTVTFVSLPKVFSHKESSLCRPSRKLLQRNLAITDHCVGIVLEPIAVIYIGFPFSTKDRIFAILYCRNSWETENKALGSVISGIVRLSGQAILSYGYEWLLVFKAAISQSELTRVNLNDPKKLVPIPLVVSGEREITYSMQGGCPYTLCSVSLGK